MPVPDHILTSPFHRRTLSNEERLEYIDAIKCLKALPAQTGAIFPGAKTRYDDFFALHINSTDYVHFNVSLGVPTTTIPSSNDLVGSLFAVSSNSSHPQAVYLNYINVCRWHRWLLHLWESELRTTCGYTGYQS